MGSGGGGGKFGYRCCSLRKRDAIAAEIRQARMEVRSDRTTGKKRAFKIQDGARLDSMFEEVDRDPFDFSSGAFHSIERRARDRVK